MARLRRIVRGFRSLRIARDTVSFELLIVVGAIPIAGPLPDISCHVEETVSIWRELCDRSDSRVSILSSVFVRKMTLVSIGHPFAFGAELIAPDIWLTCKAAASSELPFSFRGKTLTCPFRVGKSVLIGDMNNGIVLLANDAALRTEWVTPICAGDVGPPLIVVVERNGMIWRSKDDRSCYQV